MASESETNGRYQFRHHGKETCDECGELYDPAVFVHPDKDEDPEEEDPGTCPTCLVRERDKRKLGYDPLEEFECTACGEMTEREDAMRVTHYHHWGNSRTETLLVCSRKCQSRLERVGF